MDSLVFNQSFFMAKSINNRTLLEEFSLAALHCSLELNILDALHGTKRTQYKLIKTSENTTDQNHRSMISSPIINKNKGRVGVHQYLGAPKWFPSSQLSENLLE